MTEAIIGFFRDVLGNDFLTTFIIAIIPIIELRGAIPVAIEMGLQWWAAFGLAYAGSIVIVPILLMLLKPILNLMKKVKIFARLANAVEGMFQEKAEKIAKKAGGGDSKRKEDWIKIIGVFTFVALPIPLTGVWTGAAIAVFLGMPFWKSLASIMLGNLVAGAIVTMLSVFFKPYLDIVLTVFFVLVLVLIVFYIVMISLRMIKSKKADKLKKSQAEVHSLDTGDSVAVDTGKEGVNCINAGNEDINCTASSDDNINTIDADDKGNPAHGNDVNGDESSDNIDKGNA